MKKNHILLILLSVAGVLFLGGCAGGKETVSVTQQQPVRTQVQLSTENQAAQEAFIDGLKSKMLEDLEDAMKLFTRSLKLDPTNHAAYYELASLYFRLGDYEQALKNIKSAVQLNDKNKWYLLLYAEMLSYRGQYPEAAEVYEKLLNQNPNEIELYFDWAFMLIKAEKLEDAIKVYDQYEKTIGIDENVIVQKQRLYVRLGKLDKAAAEIRKLINEFPGEARYYKMLADMYEANNQKDKAYKVYEELLQIDKENPNAQLYIAEMYRVKGDHAQAMEYLKKAFANPQLGIDAKVRILFPFLQQIMANMTDKKEDAFSLAQILIETHSTEAKAHAIYGDLLYQDKQMEDALAQYEQALELDSSVYEIWQQIFFIQSELKHFEELEKISQSALDYFPNQPLVYFFNGVSKNQLRKYKEAIEILEIGVPLVMDNPLLKAQMWSSIGEAYNNLEKFPESDEAFDNSLKLDPENAYTLNNYSYYLSLRNDKLQEAKEMSAKSNKIVQDNSAFQDTYAWILYKMGEYKEALNWIEKSMKNGGDESPVILEHYGDILFQLGEVDKAVIYWQKAKSLGSESELIGRKIADRKIYE